MKFLNDIEKELLVKADESTPHECRGLVYRCRINRFRTSQDGYVEAVRMYLLKKESCDGLCNDGHCRRLLEDMNEQIYNESGPVINNPKHNGKYSLQITNIGRDWETGIIDEWDLEFVLIKDDLSVAEMQQLWEDAQRHINELLEKGKIAFAGEKKKEKTVV